MLDATNKNLYNWKWSSHPNEVIHSIQLTADSGAWPCIENQNKVVLSTSVRLPYLNKINVSNINTDWNCRYNIQYGRVNALDADIVAAAKSADIHSRILSFPEAYNTQVSYNPVINVGVR